MKLAVIGSRNFDNYELLEQHLSAFKPTIIISGGAKGADMLAERYATKYDINTAIIKPDWKKYGRGAGVVRNRAIVDAADQIIAFWDGQSKGTKSSIEYARKVNKPVTIVNGNLILTHLSAK